MAEDALNTIEDALKVQEPLTIEPQPKELEPETKAWLDKMNAVDALNNIADICVDWDGYRTADGLGGLINEIWAYARYCAQKLSQAPEPRILKPNELCNFTFESAWVELKHNEVLTLVEWDKITLLTLLWTIGSWDSYGKLWRCWSAKPTDEQRKMVKWND